jgi:2,3-bisphosphoglycerate-dependent phosphoglycerate mutase
MHFITLLRHGESEGNSEGVLQGQADFALTPHGVQQAERLANSWKISNVRFDLIISSPLLRASQTAEIVANALQAPVEFEPDWKERNMGELQGTKLRDLVHQNPPIDFFHPYDAIGSVGESQLDLYIRACRALQKIIRKTDGSYLVVSHGGILNKAIFAIMGITPQGHYNSPIIHFGNAGYAQFRYNSISRQWAVLNLNNQQEDIETEGQLSWKID